VVELFVNSRPATVGRRGEIIWTRDLALLSATAAGPPAAFGPDGLEQDTAGRETIG